MVLPLPGDAPAALPRVVVQDSRPHSATVTMRAVLVLVPIGSRRPRPARTPSDADACNHCSVNPVSVNLLRLLRYEAITQISSTPVRIRQLSNVLARVRLPPHLFYPSTPDNIKSGWMATRQEPTPPGRTPAQRPTPGWSGGLDTGTPTVARGCTKSGVVRPSRSWVRLRATFPAARHGNARPAVDLRSEVVPRDSGPCTRRCGRAPRDACCPSRLCVTGA